MMAVWLGNTGGALEKAGRRQRLELGRIAVRDRCRRAFSPWEAPSGDNVSERGARLSAAQHIRHAGCA